MRDPVPSTVCVQPHIFPAGAQPQSQVHLRSLLCQGMPPWVWANATPTMLVLTNLYFFSFEGSCLLMYAGYKSRLSGENWLKLSITISLILHHLLWLLAPEETTILAFFLSQFLSQVALVNMHWKSGDVNRCHDLLTQLGYSNSTSKS